MPARDSNRNGEIGSGDRAMPDFVAASALPDHGAAGGFQQFAQRPVELRRHSRGRGFCFAQGRDLKKDR